MVHMRKKALVNEKSVNAYKTASFGFFVSNLPIFRLFAEAKKERRGSKR